MKKIALLFIGLLLCTSHSIVAQGTISTQHFYSNNLGRDMFYNVYFPPSYNQDTVTRYPVLYLFHGIRGRYFDWGNSGTADTLNNEIAKGAREMLVIMPNGIDAWYDNYCVNWEDYMYKELIPNIEKTFRVSKKGENRAVAGLSMGGWGSTYYWIKYPSMYSSVYCMSGAFVGSDTTGHDLKKMINNMTEKERNALPAYTMEIGTEDFLYKKNVDWDHFLTTKGIKHTYIERTGIHDWPFWRGCLPKAVWFASEHFGKTQKANDTNR